jgi:hypothetical protein
VILFLDTNIVIYAEHGADIFLTNDIRLNSFTDLTVEVLT